MKTFKHTFLALALLSIVACNQSSNKVIDGTSNEGGVTQNDSIVNTDNPPPSRDLTALADTDSVETSLKFSETETQMKIILSNSVIFEDGSAKFKPSAQANLEEAFHVINGRGIGKVLVSGNTGREGDPKQNQQLSTERAMAIAKWLKGKELKKELTISSQGVGSTYPMVSYELTDGSPNAQANNLNDRTEITFRKSKIPAQ